MSSRMRESAELGISLSPPRAGCQAPPSARDCVPSIEEAIRLTMLVIQATFIRRSPANCMAPHPNWLLASVRGIALEPCGFDADGSTRHVGGKGQHEHADALPSTEYEKVSASAE